MSLKIEIDREQITAFCGKWRIAELALFGSVLREDFQPDSDVDILVRFQEDAHWSLLDIVDMKSELEEVFHRGVDLLTRRAIENSHNWIRRRAILENLEHAYVQ